MNRDTLFLLQTPFKDPQYPGELFFCWECALIEGVLASFPEINIKLEVRRVSWTRPRQELIDSVGEANQSLPLLILVNEGEVELYEGQESILAAFYLRFGIPKPHP
jgi:hypothetical protein